MSNVLSARGWSVSSVVVSVVIIVTATVSIITSVVTIIAAIVPVVLVASEKGISDFWPATDFLRLNGRFI